MKSLFNYVTVISGVLMITAILLQARSSSLGAGFGGEASFSQTRRGAERVLYLSTIGFAVVFVLSIILSILSKR